MFVLWSTQMPVITVILIFILFKVEIFIAKIA